MIKPTGHWASYWYEDGEEKSRNQGIEEGRVMLLRQQVPRQEADHHMNAGDLDAIQTLVRGGLKPIGLEFRWQRVGGFTAGSGGGAVTAGGRLRRKGWPILHGISCAAD